VATFSGHGLVWVSTEMWRASDVSDVVAEQTQEDDAKMTSVNDVTKLSSEYNNAANLSREYRSSTNVLDPEGTLLYLLIVLREWYRSVQIGWIDVTYLWSQYDRHFVGKHRRTVCS